MIKEFAFVESLVTIDDGTIPILPNYIGIVSEVIVWDQVNKERVAIMSFPEFREYTLKVARGEIRDRLPKRIYTDIKDAGKVEINYLVKFTNPVQTDIVVGENDIVEISKEEYLKLYSHFEASAVYVECIKSNDGSLIHGKRYRVLGIYGDSCYRILDSHGYTTEHYKGHFKIV